MKRIHLLFSISVLSFFLASCHKEEGLIPSADPMPLRLQIVAENFVSIEGNTRASEEGYTTKFATDDKIGVFAVRKNGTIIHNNVPYIYNSSNAWVPVDEGNEVYQYSYLSDVTYFAYYPYSAGMNNAASEEDIISKFTPKTNQKAYADYTASDLLTGAGILSEAGSKQTLTFALKHRMALLVLYPDAYANCVAPDGADYEYYPDARCILPVSNSQINSVSCYDVGDGTHRLIVKPGDLTVSLSYTADASKYNQGTETVSFSSPTLQKINAGTYHQFKMEYRLNTIIKREMQVGDFFYKDGKLMPGIDGGELVRQDDCIGVVIHVGPGEDDMISDYKNTGLYSRGKIRGYVMSKTYYTSENTSTDQYYIKWMNSLNIIGTIANKTSFRGYYNTQLMLKQGSRVASVATTKFGGAPNDSSGWYLGSAGQYLLTPADVASVLSSLNKFGIYIGGVGPKTWTSTEDQNDAANNAYIAQINGMDGIAKIAEIPKDFPALTTTWAMLTF